MKNKNYNLIIFILLFLLASSIIVMSISTLNLLIVKSGDTIQDANYNLILLSHVKENNLSYPLPNWDMSEKDIVGDYLFNKYYSLELEEFKQLIQDNYYYEEGSYDCKYWAFVWNSYFIFNKEKLNYKTKFVTTPNHMFLIAYNNKGYCIIDGKNFDCYE